MHFVLLVAKKNIKVGDVLTYSENLQFILIQRKQKEKQIDMFYYSNIERVPQLGDIFRVILRTGALGLKYQVSNIEWSAPFNISGTCMKNSGKVHIDRFYNASKLMLLSFNNIYQSMEQLSMFTRV